MTTFTVLSTFPGRRSSANVGDQLIEIALKRLLERERGPVGFLTLFREEPLEPRLAEVNTTAAILLPGCAIRDTPIHPLAYRLTADLDQITVPLIPVGANWNTYPGDAESRRATRLPESTVAFLRRISARTPLLSCREHHAREVLRRHGILNTVMTGDPAWYDPDCFGRPWHRPREVRSVAFSPPLSAWYRDQGVAVLRLLRDQFPDARRYCAMHLTDRHASPFSDRQPTNDASMRGDVAEKKPGYPRGGRAAGFQSGGTRGRRRPAARLLPAVRPPRRLRVSRPREHVPNPAAVGADCGRRAGRGLQLHVRDRRSDGLCP
jgi:hypothetical protein